MAIDLRFIRAHRRRGQLSIDPQGCHLCVGIKRSGIGHLVPNDGSSGRASQGQRQRPGLLVIRGHSLFPILDERMPNGSGRAHFSWASPANQRLAPGMRRIGR